MATSQQKFGALAPTIQAKIAGAVNESMVALGVPAFLRTKLSASVSTRVAREVGGFLERGAGHIDDQLALVAGFCAGLRSDGNPLAAEELPEPFDREQLGEVHRWIVGGDPVPV